MGITKSDLFTERQNKLAELLKCLGHPARIAIIDYLVEKKTCINTSLVNEIGLAQPTISQHLKALKDVGLIKGTVEGNAMNYCIDMENWKHLKIDLEKFFKRSIIDGFECC